MKFNWNYKFATKIWNIDVILLSDQSLYEVYFDKIFWRIVYLITS